MSRLTVFAVVATTLAACSGGSEGGADSAPAGQPSSEAPSVTPTGKVITVEMYTDANGSYFKPNRIDAKKGDVIRFTLKSGVHNVHFVADSNPGRRLPPASEFLQLPGQTWDLTVAFEPGSHYFQCDPHALLGMTGRVEVSN